MRRFDAAAAPLPAERVAGPSTHALGLPEAIELARALDRLPRRVVLYGIESETMAAGDDLTPAVDRAVEEVVMRLLADLDM